MDVKSCVRQIWGRCRRLAGMVPPQDAWRLFVRMQPDGAVSLTLVNFADGVHRRILCPQLCPEAAAFLRQHQVDLGSVNLASVVRCASPRVPYAWRFDGHL